jgi:hypothetical protein
VIDAKFNEENRNLIPTIVIESELKLLDAETDPQIRLN